MRIIIGLLLVVASLTQVIAKEVEVITSHAITVRGEAKYPKDFKHWDYVNPDAPQGGTVTFGTLGTFDNFNRYASRGSSAAIIEDALFDSLLVENDEEPEAMYGFLAEEMTYPVDNSWIIFKLNPKAKFQDGVPVKASDVVFSLNKFMTQGVPQFRKSFEGVKAEALNEHEVKFSFPDPQRRSLMVMGSLPVLPEHYWKNIDFSEPVSDQVPLGSGPFKVKDYEMGKYIVYEKDPNYWAKDHPAVVGRNNFQFYRYDYYLDETVQLEAFKKGEFDFRTENKAKEWATSYEGDNFDKGFIIKEEVPHETPAGMPAFVFNVQKPVFQDRRVRMAVSMLFDFEWSNKNLFYNAYVRPHSYFQNTKYMATGLPEGKELEILNKFKGKIPDEVFSNEFELYKTDGSGNIRKQLRSALKLLKEAGWSLKEGKLVSNETGEQMTFEIIIYQSSSERILVPFKNNLAKAGINFEITMMDTSRWINRLRDRKFDMIRRGFDYGTYPPGTMKIAWHSDYMDSSWNLAGPMDPVIDEIVLKIEEYQQDEEMLLAYGKAFDRIALWNHYVIPNWYISKYRIAYWDKFARPPEPPKYDLGFDTWWYDTEKAKKLPKRNAPN